MRLRSEKDVIRAVIERAASEGLMEVGDLPLYDDVFAFRLGGVHVVLKIDGFGSRSVLLPWNTLQDLGWKAVTACLSDIYVKNAVPKYILVSVGAETPEGAYRIMEGVMSAASYYGVRIAGGDTNRARGESWVDVAAVGISGRPLARRSARKGDLIVVTGHFGSTGAVFQALARGLDPMRVGAVDCLRAATSRPKAVSGFPKLVSALGDCITASIDVSDGLAASLHQLSEASGHVLMLNSAPPVDECTKGFIEEAGLDLRSAVFYGGEEYEAVFTVDPKCRDALEGLCERVLGRPCTVVGTVGERGEGVIYKGERLEPGGWDHFVSALP